MTTADLLDFSAGFGWNAELPKLYGKTSCSISGPTSTTIAPIPQWKGERRICLRHDQSQISARFDGNLTVGPYIRHQWLRDFRRLSMFRYPANLGKIPNYLNHLVLASLVAARFADPIVSLQPYQFARDMFRSRLIVNYAASEILLAVP